MIVKHKSFDAYAFPRQKRTLYRTLKDPRLNWRSYKGVIVGNEDDDDRSAIQWRLSCLGYEYRGVLLTSQEFIERKEVHSASVEDTVDEELRVP